MPLTRAQVDLIAEKARRMPPAPPAEANLTKQEAVRVLAPEIADLRRKGYTWDQIVASFRGDGLNLSTATMKSYLSRAKASKSRRRGGPKQTPVPTKGAAPLTEREAPPSTKRETAPLTEKETPQSTKRETPPLTEKETPPSTRDTPAKSGKDAFLVEDKKDY